MARNPPFFTRRPLTTEARPLGARAGLPGLVIALIVIAVFGGGVLADHYDSLHRMAHIRAALAARGLAPAQVDRDWPRVYRCKHAYRWRTASANGSACTDSFSGAVSLYSADGSADGQPLATPGP
jgi:hypothetical protein